MNYVRKHQRNKRNQFDIIESTNLDEDIIELEQNIEILMDIGEYMNFHEDPESLENDDS